MTAGEIFRSYVRFIGVGAIATAGIFGIIKSLRSRGGIVRHRAANAFRHGEASEPERTDRDMPMIAILSRRRRRRARRRCSSSGNSRSHGRWSQSASC